MPGSLRGWWLVLCVLPGLAVGDSADHARVVYEQAQTDKRNGQFERARTGFESLAEQKGTSTWADLAFDELNFGLPLFESDSLLARLAATPDPQARGRILTQVETLYGRIIEANTDRPERIAEIERRRDQLSLLTRATRQHERDNLTSGLARLRGRIQQYYRSHGRWPDRPTLAAEVAGMLGDAGLGADRLELFEYYPTSSSFYATLRDSRGGPDIKIKAEGSRVEVEGGGH